MIFSDTSKWKVEYVPGTSLLNLDEQILQSSTELKSIIHDWKPMEDSNEGNAQTVAARLNFTYKFDEAKRTRADRKSTRLNSSHVSISYAVFCVKKKKRKTRD